MRHSPARPPFRTIGIPTVLGTAVYRAVLNCCVTVRYVSLRFLSAHACSSSARTSATAPASANEADGRRPRHCADCLRSVRCIRDGHLERRNGSGRRRSAQHGASESLGLASDDRLAARGALAQLRKASFTADCVATTEAHLTWSIEANETLGERLTRRALLRQQWRTRGRLVDPKALCASASTAPRAPQATATGPP